MNKIFFYELFLYFVFTLLEAMQWYLLFKLVSLTNLMDVLMAYIQKKQSKTLILSVFQPFYMCPSFATTLYIQTFAAINNFCRGLDSWIQLDPRLTLPIFMLLNIMGPNLIWWASACTAPSARSCKRSNTLFQKSLLLFLTWRAYFYSQPTHFSSQPKK